MMSRLYWLVWLNVAMIRALTAVKHLTASHAKGTPITRQADLTRRARELSIPSALPLRRTQISGLRQSSQPIAKVKPKRAKMLGPRKGQQHLQQIAPQPQEMDLEQASWGADVFFPTKSASGPTEGTDAAEEDSDSNSSEEPDVMDKLFEQVSRQLMLSRGSMPFP